MKKKSVKISVTAFLLLLVICRSGSGQTPNSTQLPRIVPATPEAMAIAKYINYPVDHYTGLPKIEIPLYEIKAGDMVLPITLSYHSSGLKLNENDGWIGLGWTLNVAPAVSRSIKGMADEEKKGYLNNPRVTSSSNPDSYYIELANGYIDGEPDEFYYKLLDKGGAFYLRHPDNKSAKRFLTIPYDPINISYRTVGTDVPQIEEVSITDENGIFYRFPNVESTHAAYNRLIGNTCWKASQVISSDRADTISFSYRSSTETASTRTDAIVVEDAPYGQTTGNVITGCLSDGHFPYVYYSTGEKYTVNSYGELVNTYCTYMPPMPGNTGWDTYTIYGQTFSAVNFRGGSITFTSENVNGRLKLSEIRIFNQSGLLKKITFHRSAYGSPGLTNKLYSLDEVRIKDKFSNNVEKYQFQYYSSGSFPDYVQSTDKDHWGYYNGAGNDPIQTAVPVFTIEGKEPLSPEVTFQIGHANKNAVEEAMKSGILERIIYPSGGSTVFAYEAHTCWDYEKDEKVSGGGLRIRSIINTDASGAYNATTGYRSFQYGSDYRGVGYARWPLSEDDYMYQQTFEHGPLGDTRVRTYFSQSMADLFYSNGSAVVYDEVTEYLNRTPGFGPPWEYPDGLGWTTHKYSVSGKVGTHIPGTPLYNVSIDWMGGKPTEKDVISNNVYIHEGPLDFDTVAVDKKAYKTFNFSETVPVDRVFRRRIMFGEFYDPGREELTYGSFYHNTGIEKVISETTTYPKRGGYFSQHKTYQYNKDSRLLKPYRTETVTSDGDSIVETFRYVPDGNFGTSDAARQQLIDNGNSGALLRYGMQKGNNPAVYTFTEYGLFKGMPLPSAVKTQINDMEKETRIVYQEYDEYGNPVYVSKDDATRFVYLWGYNGKYPIAEIVNATYADVTGCISEQAMQAIARKAEPAPSDWDTINILRSRLGNALITTFRYLPLVGITEIKDPRGISTYYRYDAFGRLSQTYIIENGIEKTIQSNSYHYKNQ